MNAISLTKDHWQTISRAIESCMDDHYNEIRKYAADDSSAYCEMMDEFEKLAGVRALLNQAMQTTGGIASQAAPSPTGRTPGTLARLARHPFKGRA